MKELNDFLAKYDATVVLKRGIGYEMLHKENVQELFTELHSQSTTPSHQLETSEDRIKQLLLLFLFSEKEISLDELCNQLYVGRTTILGYIRQLRLLLASYEIKITSKVNIGYKIVGEESAIRQVISDQLIEKNFESYISQFSRNEYELFHEINLVELSQLVTDYFPPNLYKISDYHRKNFVIHLAIAILRVKNQHHLESVSSFFIIDEKIQSSIRELLVAIEKRIKSALTFKTKYGYRTISF